MNLLQHGGFYLMVEINSVLKKTSAGEDVVVKSLGYVPEADIKEGTYRISSKLEQIGDSCFANNLALKWIDIPSNINKIGAWAFANSGLQSIELPSNVTTIGDGLFSNCRSLTRFNIGGSGFDTIRRWMFEKCVALTSIIIPANIILIDDLAFADCSNLTSVRIVNEGIQIAPNAFRNTRALEKITVGSGSRARNYFKNADGNIEFRQ